MDKPHPKEKRVCANIPFCLDLKLNYNASKRFLFANGWKKLAIIEAVKFWIWIINNDPELYKQMKENIKHIKYEDKQLSRGSL